MLDSLPLFILHYWQRFNMLYLLEFTKDADQLQPDQTSHYSNLDSLPYSPVNRGSVHVKSFDTSVRDN